MEKAAQQGVEADEDRQATTDSSLSRLDQKRLTKRINQVKVLLNEEELEQLDWIVERMGSDRSSVMRYLLSNAPKATKSQKHPIETEAEPNEDEVPRIRVGEIPGPWPQKKPCISLFEPTQFEHIPQTVDAIRNGEAIVINLTMMEPDQAQRAVDFIAGAAFYGLGHQERVGESIFLFASQDYEVSTIENLNVIKDTNAEALEASRKIAIGGGQKGDLIAQTIETNPTKDMNDKTNDPNNAEEAVPDDTASETTQIFSAEE